MDNLLENLEDYYKNCDSDGTEEKSIYDELAEKEQALTLAAQFGKTLLEEKEQLEYQLDTIKKEYQNKIEILEQERYALKLLVESIRNEYENKIYEYNEDLNLMHKQLESQQNDINVKNNDKNTFIEIINELTDKNQKLIEELKMYRTNNYCLEEKYHKMEEELEEKENKYADNLKLLNSFKKEISMQIKKQQDLEYLVMQTCSERDQKAHLLEENANKLAFFEAEKHKLDEIVYQQEQQILDLQSLNEELNHKLTKYHLNNRRNNRPRFNCLMQKYNRNNSNSNKNNAKSLYEDEDDIVYDHNELDIFRIEDDDTSNLNWQDECQISEQQINNENNNSNQSDDFEEEDNNSNNSLSSSTFNTSATLKLETNNENQLLVMNSNNIDIDDDGDVDIDSSSNSNLNSNNTNIENTNCFFN